MNNSFTNKLLIAISLWLGLASQFRAQSKVTQQTALPGVKPAGAGIAFSENSGQVRDQHNRARPDVLFGGSNKGLAFHIRKSGISYQLSRVDEWKAADACKTISRKNGKLIPGKTTVYRVDINWINQNTDFSVNKETESGSPSYYFNQNGSFTSHAFQKVTYKNIYPGIDIKWYEKDGELEYDYICKAGADYRKIKLDIKGATKISFNAQNDLLIETPLGTICEKAPVVIQNGKTLKSKWVIYNNYVGFDIPELNLNAPYRIDPVVRVWGTYYGGSGNEEGVAVATHTNGDVYMAGYTFGGASGSIIATSGAHQTTFAGGFVDAFVVKFNASGVRQWATYCGGNDDDNLRGMAIDGTGNVFICGFTSSSVGIATSGAHQTSLATGTFTTNDAFLVKFNSSGVRQWGTYYGGTGQDDAYTCSTDPSGNVYIGGTTDLATSTIIATSGAHQNSKGGGTFDAYLAKFNSNGVRQWATYYGGTDEDNIAFSSTDASGNVYTGGSTTSTNAIASSGHQNSFGGFIDGFVVKFNSSGVRQWASYYGGTGWDEGRASAVDGSGNVFLGGLTDCTVSSVIATSGAQQTTNVNGTDDGYLVKFNSSGVRQWGTYYGGENPDNVNGCTVDASGDVFITGNTSSTLTGAIATPGNYQTTLNGMFNNAYLAKFNGAGVRQWGTYYGTDSESGYQCALDANGNIYLAGSGTSTAALATSGAHQTTNGGNTDAFLAKFSECGAASQPTNNTPPANQIVCGSGNTTTLLATVGTGTVNWYATATSTNALGTGTAFATPTLAIGTYTYYAEGLSCQVSASRTAITLTVFAQPTISATSGTICQGQTFTITAGGVSSFSVQGGSATVSPSSTTSYSVTGTGTNGCLASNTATSIITVNSAPTITVASTTICAGKIATITPTGAASYSIAGGTLTATGTSFTTSPATSTSYTVTGTNASGCVSASGATLSITVNTVPVVTASGTSVCPGTSVSINPGGATTYTLASASQTLNGGTTFTVNPSATTNYSITGTSAQGCVSSNTAVVTITAASLPTITVSNYTICTGQSATIVPNGASTYSITGSNFTVSPASTTSYSVIGTGTNGCTQTVSTVFSVVVNAGPSISANNYSVCSGQSVTIVPTGALNYTITGGNFTVTPASTTSYTITGGSGACAAVNTVVSTVSVITVPTVAVNSGSICSGQVFTIVPTGGTNYTVQGNSFTVNPGSNSTYTVTGANGSCLSQNTATATINVISLPTVAAGGGSICSGQSFTIAPSGATSYTISGGSFTVSPATTSSYSITGSNGGCVAANTVVTTISVTPTPTLTVNSGSICPGQVFTILPSGASNYTVQGNSFTVNPTSNSTYTVTGSNGSCLSQNVVTASVAVIPVPTLAASGGSICSGDSFTIVPSGAASYSISGGSFTVSPATTSSYNLTGSNGNCVASNTVVVTVSVTPTPTVAVNSGSICAGAIFTITPTGATNYTVQGNSYTVSPGSSSTYTVIGANGACLSQNTATATVAILPTPTLSVIDATICPGESFTISPSGVDSFTVHGGNSVVSPTSNSSYTVTGSNTSGCLAQNIGTVNITVLPSPTITVSSGTINICPGIIPEPFNLNPQGALIYAFSSPEGQYVSPAVTTIYTVSGSDINGCANSATAEVVVVLTPTVSFSTSSLAICPNQSAAVTIQGAAPPYTLSVFYYVPYSGDNFGTLLSTQTLTSNSFTVPFDIRYEIKKYTVASGAGVCGTSASDSLIVNSVPTIRFRDDFKTSRPSGYFGERVLYEDLNHRPFMKSEPKQPDFVWSPQIMIEPQNALSATIYNLVGNGPAYCILKDSPSTVTTVYTLTTYYLPECPSTQTLELYALEDPVVPNFFSPDGDGANDQWLIVLPKNVRMNSIVVTDMNGTKVVDLPISFQGTFSWNGLITNNNYSLVGRGPAEIKVPKGDYIYNISITSEGVTRQLRGTVTVRY